MSIGYENAPITRFITISTFILSIFYPESNSIPLNIEKLFKGEIGRIFYSQFIFENMPQMFVGLILLYNCRQFERQIGVKKFGSFVAFAFIITLSIQILILFLLKSVGLNLIPTQGPYFLIFGLLRFFYAHVPKLQTTQYAIFGMALSEKSWTYLLAAQLIFANGFNSLFPGLVGLMFGYAYDINRFGLQRCRLPSIIENLASGINSFFTTLFAGSPGRVPIATGTGDNNNLFNNNRQFNAQYTRLNDFGDDFDQNLQAFGGFGTTPQPPSEESIQTLMALGFDRDTVIRALQNADNNVEAAANMLFR